VGLLTDQSPESGWFQKVALRRGHLLFSGQVESNRYGGRNYYVGLLEVAREEYCLSLRLRQFEIDIADQVTRI